MALGKAFIEVHADTAPFARELATQLDAAIRGSEREVRVSARRVGESVSEGAGEGIRRNRGRVTAGLNDVVNDSTSVLARLGKGLIDSLDDGLSGLPAELKLALAGLLVALAPVALALGAGIASALVTGLTIGGLGVIGVLLASQFEEVQDKAQTTFSNIRNTVLQGTEFFAREFINALSLVERGFTRLDPLITVTLLHATKAVVPLTDALFGLFEQALPGINRGLANIDEFLVPLQVGFRQIGAAIGDFFDTILNNPNAADAFYDILIAIEDTIQVITFLVDVGLDLYGVLRDISELQFINFQASDDIVLLAERFGIAGEEVGFFGEAISGTIAPTQAETEAIDALNQQIALLTKLTVAQISNEIAFEQGIDDLTESLKVNKDTLNLNNQAGRDNAKVLLDLATTILRTRDDTIQLTGDTDAATAAFNAQTAEVYALAKQMGLSKAEVDKIIGALLKIPPPKQSGVTASSLSRLEDFNQALLETIYLQSLIDPARNPRGPGGQQKFADGGIVTGPTNALIGEAGPEAVIPLTNPSRAAEIMNQAGLTSALSPTINVFIGNQQIDAYIDTRVNQANEATARSLAYGARGI